MFQVYSLPSRSGGVPPHCLGPWGPTTWNPLQVVGVRGAATCLFQLLAESWSRECTDVEEDVCFYLSKHTYQVVGSLHDPL